MYAPRKCVRRGGAKGMSPRRGLKRWRGGGGAGKQLEESWAQLQLQEAGAQALFAGDAASLLVAAKHLLRSAGADAADAALQLLARCAPPGSSSSAARSARVEFAPRLAAVLRVLRRWPSRALCRVCRCAHVRAAGPA